LRACIALRAVAVEIFFETPFAESMVTVFDEHSHCFVRRAVELQADAA
jgi:hypothetical protein